MHNRPALDQEYLNKTVLNINNLIAFIESKIYELSALFRYRNFSLSSVETLIEAINNQTRYFGHPENRERFQQERVNIQVLLANILLGPAGTIAFASQEYQNYEQLRDALNLSIDKEKGLEIIKGTGIFESAISVFNAAIKARDASRVTKAPNRLSTGHEAEKRKEKVDNAITKPASMPKKSQEELNTALFSAISNNELEQVQKAIDAGADVNCRNERLQSPLVYACVNEKSRAIFELLINNKADVNVTMPYNRNDTILDRVIMVNKIDYAALLLDHNAQPGADRGQKIWFDAARQPAMLSLLMRKGVKIDWSCLDQLFIDRLRVFNGIVSLIENEITMLVASLTKPGLDTKAIIETLNHYIDYISGTEKIFKEKRADLRVVLVQKVKRLVDGLNRYSNVGLFKARLTLVMAELRLVTDGHLKKQSMKDLEAYDRQLDKKIKDQANDFVGSIQGEQVDQVDKLLAAGVNLEANRAAILDAAISVGNCYIFQRLVEQGMNVHREIKPGLTPVVHAIRWNRFDMLSFLVEIKGVEIDWNGLKNNQDDTKLAALVAERVASLISPATFSNSINTHAAIIRINQKTIYLPNEPELRAVFLRSIKLALDTAILSTLKAIEATKSPKTVLASLQALMKDICPLFRVTGPVGAKVLSFISSLRNRLNAELLQAAEQGDYMGVSLAIANGADIDCKNAEGLTPLCLAARRSYLSIIEQLIHLGADRDNAMEAVLISAKKMCYTIVRKLIDETLNVNHRSASGYNLLILAANANDKALLRTLLSAKAEVDWPYIKEGLIKLGGSGESFNEKIQLIREALIENVMSYLYNFQFLLASTQFKCSDVLVNVPLAQQWLTAWRMEDDTRLPPISDFYLKGGLSFLKHIRSNFDNQFELIDKLEQLLIDLGVDAADVGGPTRERAVVVGPAVLAASPSVEVVNLPEANTVPIEPESSILNADLQNVEDRIKNIADSISDKNKPLAVDTLNVDVMNAINAINADDLDTLERLIQEDPTRLNKKDAFGNTPLMAAARKLRKHMVLSLINMGASIEWSYYDETQTMGRVVSRAPLSSSAKKCICDALCVVIEEAIQALFQCKDTAALLEKIGIINKHAAYLYSEFEKADKLFKPFRSQVRLVLMKALNKQRKVLKASQDVDSFRLALSHASSIMDKKTGINIIQRTPNDKKDKEAMVKLSAFVAQITRDLEVMSHGEPATDRVAEINDLLSFPDVKETDLLIDRLNADTLKIKRGVFANSRGDIQAQLVGAFKAKQDPASLAEGQHTLNVLDKVLTRLDIIQGTRSVNDKKTTMHELRLLRDDLNEKVHRLAMLEAPCDAVLDPFTELTSGNQARVRRAIIDLKVDVNCQNAEGMTPLVFLSRYYDSETLKLLIEHGAKIDLIRLAVLELPDPNNSEREIKVLDAILATTMERVKVMEDGFVALLKRMDASALDATQTVISDAVNFIKDKINYLSTNADLFGRECAAILSKEKPGWSRESRKWCLGQIAFDHRRKLAVDCLVASLKNVKEKWSAVIDENKLLLLQENVIKLSAITTNNELNEFVEARLVKLKAVSRVSGSSVTLFGEHARAASAPTAPKEDPRYGDPSAGL